MKEIREALDEIEKLGKEFDWSQLNNPEYVFKFIDEQVKETKHDGLEELLQRISNITRDNNTSFKITSGKTDDKAWFIIPGLEKEGITLNYNESMGTLELEAKLINCTFPTDLVMFLYNSPKNHSLYIGRGCSIVSADYKNGILHVCFEKENNKSSIDIK